jgi:hypothetical protein
MSFPVMKEAAGLISHSMADATSAGVPIRGNAALFNFSATAAVLNSMEAVGEEIMCTNARSGSSESTRFANSSTYRASGVSRC